MKTLTLVRHAKSEWGNEGLADCYRPLNATGYTDAGLISKQLVKKIPPPTYWLTSPAIRAYSTAFIFSNTFKYETENIQIKNNIYEAPFKTLKKILSALPDKHQNVILFGHNPGLTDLFNDISDSYADNIPAGGVVHLIYPDKYWKNISNFKLKNDFYLYPKEFK
ncbi:MAG: histidine phosphatase family protein [Bacteroidetes bacterium]|nr:histidine phosphatase family protein [Bacteroidota bacterium]